MIHRKLAAVIAFVLLWNPIFQAGNAEAIKMNDQYKVLAVSKEKKKSNRKKTNSSEAPRTGAKAFALIDVTTGRILHSDNGETRLPMASTTKIMTAIVALESGKLNDKVKTSKRAVGKEGSSIYLRLGEEMTLQHLIYGLMLRSGNDAAVAIAEHVGGSEDGFVYMMNQKSEELGLENTSFRNPHGLDQKEHYTSAHDLAQLSAYALHNKHFQTIVQTKVKVVPNPIEKWDYKWTNKNKMLRFYAGADGVKTGYTSNALRCLVSSATRNGQQLAVVTLNDGDDWNDHQALLDYGFAHYPLTNVIEKGYKLEGQPYEIDASWSYPLRTEEQSKIQRKVEWFQPNSLDYRLGHRGKLSIWLEDKLIGSIPIKNSMQVETNQLETNQRKTTQTQ
ncbi:D-alanyl-D-alanine carboxypeptidase [Paenibacillus sp. SC116]|uniref:D-alanyl-D-alanine carboxypeptidase family protein n=1 Tax=Paenibacillus sp. SC116 TaxID=2968986 RepID=UPI00215A426D|nr:D-alanyl-D-alanine carboxypeptidase family protein [Paenibacillus sp. SC116]MCR8843009.1 D-alanyl-D-alanine carboxypeptidase [Paenibacillus sp. SC116]